MRKIILLSIGVAIFNLLLIIMILFPLFVDLNKVANDIIVLRKDSVSFEKELEIAEQFNNSYDSLELKQENIEYFLINFDVPIDLIKFFENTAKDSNLMISIFPSSIGKPEKGSWGSMSFNIELLGDFLGFSRFLEKLETSHYFLEIQSIQLRKITKEELYLEKYEGFSTGQVKTTLKVRVYTR